MVSNFCQAIDYLSDYLGLHIGNHFNKVLWLAERVRHHNTENEVQKHRYQLDRLVSLLEKKFFATESEYNEVISALEGNIDHFHDQFVKLILKKFEDPELHRDIENEVIKVANKLELPPYNFPSNGLDHYLKAEFMAEVHWARGEDGFADQWSKLSSELYYSHLKHATEEVYEDWSNEITQMSLNMYEKFQYELGLPFYVLRLVHAFPYLSTYIPK